MKQTLFLLAIYALILNQVRKDEKDIVPSKPAPSVSRFATAGTSAQYHVEKFRYFDQTVYLITSAENKQRMIVFEDGTVMDVLDETANDQAVKAYRYSSAVMQSKAGAR